MADESLSLRLFGHDISASRALAGVGRQAAETSRRLADIGKTGALMGAKLAGGAQIIAQTGQLLTQAGAGAGVLAPALLTAGQALGTFKILGDEAKARLKALQPEFDGVKRAAAAAFGPKFSESLKLFGSNLPVVKEGVRQTAAVFGDLSIEAGKVFSGPAFRRDLADVMSVNAEATRSLGRAGISMAGAFWDVAVAAKDVWANFSGLVESGARQVALWVEAKRESGELTAAIKRGADTIGNIVTAIWNFGVGVKSIFGAISADGTNLSEVLLNISERFRDWATSAQTVNAVSAFFSGLRTAVSLAKDAIVEASAQFKTGFATGEIASDATGLAAALQAAGARAREMADLVKNELWPTLKALGAVVRDDVLPIAAQLSLTFSGVVNSAIATVARVVRDDLVPILQTLAPFVRDVVVPAVQELARWCQDTLFPAVERIGATIRDNFIPALNGLWAAINDNKPQLLAFWQGLQDVATVILAVVEFAIKVNLVTSIRLAGEAITTVIQLLGLFVQALAQAATAALTMALNALGAFKEVANGALTMVTGVVGTMAKLPGPLGAPWRSAETAIESFRTNVDSKLGAAETRVRQSRDSINTWLDGIKDKTVTIKVVEQRTALTSYQQYVAGARAGGGPVDAGKTYLVGEDGPEIVRMSAAGTVYDAATSARMLTGGLGRALSATSPAAGGVVVIVHNHIAGSLLAQRGLEEATAAGVRDALAGNARSNGRRVGLPRG